MTRGEVDAFTIGLSIHCDSYALQHVLVQKLEDDKHLLSFTMRCFMEEYMTRLSSVTNEDQMLSIQRMQSQFSITSVKVLLVCLLNGEYGRKLSFFYVGTNPSNLTWR